MSRELTIVQPLPPGDHRAAFCGDAGGWFPDARPVEVDVWRVHIGAGGVERPVACRVGSPWWVGGIVRRRLRWTALSSEADAIPIERLLPAFDGELLLVDDEVAPSLVLEGQVDVPLGWLGEAVDALALGRLARRSARGFLATVAARLVEERARATAEEEIHPTG